ncbi:MAG: AMP-binding protein, partial [Smithella sp.]
MATTEELKIFEEAKTRYSKVNLNPLTPLNFLKRSELVFPHKKAVVYGEKYWSWQEFAERVYRVAHGLQEMGIEKLDRVALLSRNNNGMLESMYGVGMAGAVTVPMNYRLSGPEISYILNHSGSKCIMFEHIYADTIREIQSELKTVTNFILIDSPDKKEIKPLGTPYEEFLDKASPAIMD